MNNFANENKLWIKIAIISYVVMHILIVIFGFLASMTSKPTYMAINKNIINEIIMVIIAIPLLISIIAFLISAGVLVIKLLIKLIKW